jgi:dienelactone hydrolase
MSLRRKASLTFAAAALVATACSKDVKQVAPAAKIVVATFSSPNIPTPNDLAMAAANPTATPAMPDSAQKELLQAFTAAGGFPSDQAPTLTVPLSSYSYNAAANAYALDTTPPSVDAATLTASNVALFRLGSGVATRVSIEPAATQTAGSIALLPVADASGSRRLAPGRYVFAVRGGANGPKTTEGLPIGPDQAIALTIPNKDLSVPANQPPGGLSAAQIGLLEPVRAVLWNPLVWSNQSGNWAPAPDTSILPAYAAVDAAFPHAEVASIAAFSIGGPSVVVDATSGTVPLPSSFLLDTSRPVPGTSNSRFYVKNLAAFGPAAPGLATLDGFSTTGMMIAPLSQPVNATTVTKDTVFLLELPDPGTTAHPRRMLDVSAALGAGAPGSAEFFLQPPALNHTATVGGASVSVTTAIGLQPGIAVPTPTAAGIVYCPPLKQKKNYLVVITDGVKDLAGASLKRNTIASILFGFTNPPFDGTHSTIPGVSDADAAGLNAVRNALTPVITNIGALTGTTLTKDNVVMAYTVQTQTVTDTSVLLSAAPYDPNGDGNPADSVGFTAASATAFDPTAALGIPAALFPDVDSFLSASIVTLNPINPATGAFNPDTTAWTPTTIPALITVPKCATPPCVLPLVIAQHGLNGGRLQTLAVSESLAKQGFVVAAIDAPYHGDRAFCRQNSDCTVSGTDDGTCTPDQTKATQGDAVPPGTCTNGSHLKFGSNLTTVASGSYFISSNFFRLRDGFREATLDHAALVLALARPPASTGFPQPAGNAVASALAAKGIFIDPTKVYYEGLSLGGIMGTSTIATNPRFARAVLDVPGGTLVDVFTNAPAFSSAVDALFLSLGIDRSKVPTDPLVAAEYLQTLTVAKWILDPADPINYAKNVTTKLASPLTASLGAAAHATTDAFGQLAKCDQVVPNATTVVNGVPLPYGDLLLHLGGIPTTLYTSASATDNCVSHGVLYDTFAAVSGGTSIGGQVRTDAANFLLTPFSPPATFQLP